MMLYNHTKQKSQSQQPQGGQICLGKSFETPSHTSLSLLENLCSAWATKTLLTVPLWGTRFSPGCWVLKNEGPQITSENFDYGIWAREWVYLAVAGLADL